MTLFKTIYENSIQNGFKQLCSFFVFVLFITCLGNSSSFAIESSGANPGNLTPTGSHDTILFTGAFSYTYPISVPAGRNGMQPDIKLIYNSQAGNGWVGCGWDLSMGSIRRSTKNGMPNYSDTSTTTSDKFEVTLGGQSQELVQIGTGSDTNGAYIEYRAQLESNFTRFRSYFIDDGIKQWRAMELYGIQLMFTIIGVCQQY